MVSNKRIDRALYGPGLFEVTLGALMGVSLGVAVAALHLVFTPVAVLSKPPEGAAATGVYFVEGSANSAKARQWMRKHQLLSEGGSADVAFCEDELNAWMASAITKAQPAAGSTPALITPERINFRIHDGVFQVGVLGKLDAFEFTRQFVIQARGKFGPGANGFEFIADEFYIGSLPAHTVPGLTALIIRRVLAAQAVPEDLKANWRKLKLVAVEDNQVHIVVP